MSDFQKFLVPVDGSAVSEKAAAKAGELARLTGAYIDLICVSELKNGPTPQHTIRRSDLPDDVVQTLRETGRDVLQRIYDKLPPAIRERTACHAEVGNPKDIILETAGQLNSDLIIMGTRGLNPAQAIIIGSVSQHMMENAKCPVMIVH